MTTQHRGTTEGNLATLLYTADPSYFGGTRFRDMGDARATARLWLAAPRLLARLEQALRYLEHPDVQAMPFAIPTEVVARQVRAAIAAATGKGE